MLLREIVQKISKTAAAYLVGGIALIQLAPVFFNTFPAESIFGVSESTVMQFLFIIVGLGFPATLSVAYFYGGSKGEDDQYITKHVTASGDYKLKIAVIPFTNLNKDDDFRNAEDDDIDKEIDDAVGAEDKLLSDDEFEIEDYEDEDEE